MKNITRLGKKKLLIILGVLLVLIGIEIVGMSIYFRYFKYKTNDDNLEKLTFQNQELCEFIAKEYDLVCTSSGVLKINKDEKHKLDGVTNLSLNTIPSLKDLEYFKNLESLSLKLTAVTTNDLKPLVGLNSLKHLDLSGASGLNPDNMRYIEQFTNLETLDLSNLVNSYGLGLDLHVKNLVNLKQLKISNTKFVEIRDISNLTKLEVLDVENSTFSDVNELQGLTGLKELNISNNGVYDISPLSKLVNLEILNLSKNKYVKDISSLSSLTKLDVLDVTETGVTNVNAVYYNSKAVIKVSNYELTDIGINNLPPILQNLKKPVSLLMSPSEHCKLTSDYKIDFKMWVGQMAVSGCEISTEDERIVVNTYLSPDKLHN